MKYIGIRYQLALNFTVDYFSGPSHTKNLLQNIHLEYPITAHVQSLNYHGIFILIVLFLIIIYTRKE